MSAPTPINRNAAVIGTEYLGVAPPAAGSAITAAAADHVHRVQASSSEIFGFGRMLSVTVAAPNFAFVPSFGVFARTARPVPPAWTAEGWVNVSPAGAGFNAPTNGGRLQVGWAGPNGTYPAFPNGGISFLGLNNPNGGTEASLDWNGGGTGLGDANAADPQAAAPLHVFAQMDSAGNMWAGLGGKLYGPFPGAVPFASAFPAVLLAPFIHGQGTDVTCSVDEFRMSSVLRYPTSGATYEVPADPFNPDGSTLVLWHLDDIPYGQFEESAGDGAGVWVPSNFLTADSSVNGIEGQFGIIDQTGQSTGTGDIATLGGANSNVGPNSGSGAAATAESIQGQTGNFLLLDPGGNPLPVASPSGAQEIQVVGRLMGSPEYWY